MRRIISILLAATIVLSIRFPVFASDTPELTEENLWAQVADNTATVTHEVRSLDSFSQAEIEQCPGLQELFSEINNDKSRSINDNFTYGNVHITTVVTDANQTVIYRSYPVVTFNVVDVGTGSSADIYSTFEVRESVTVDGEVNTGWHNAIRYKNIAATMGCGVNTAFTDNVTLSGNSLGIAALNIKGIISFIASVAGYNTVSQILSAFDTISYSGSRVSYRDITSQYVRIVGSKMDNEVLYSNAHNLTIQSSISTIDSTQTANQSAKAVAEWVYDVYFFAGSVKPAYSDESASVTVTYKVNAK